ncbi:hypothetical protein Mgra_00002061 [Meloidogyne graminicola]|uniref:Uncharacterized protein n=1 Tax=Meloidogyne graminicola TaxID=189291 RepID=A0A8S9ZYN8_9BILA|nr:hypothetical protein Mgra_00002061 [Meloidogyne graminicola]
MGIKDSLVSLVGDFVELQRNPEFKSKSDLSKEVLFNPIDRRHSIQITCGTKEEKTPIHQRTYSAQLNNQNNNHRRQRSEVLINPLEELSFQLSNKQKERRISEPFISLPNNLRIINQNEYRKKQRSLLKCQSFDNSLIEQQNSQINYLSTNNINQYENIQSRTIENHLTTTTSPLSKSATFSRLFSHQLPIEEVEEFETNMDGQRRKSTAIRRPKIEQMHYGTIIHL